MKSNVVFGNEKLKKAFEKLKTSKTEDQILYKGINRTIDDLKKNGFCGFQIPKKQIPEIYLKKYEIDNLWKYDLPKAWGLIYSVSNGEIYIVSIVLEWMFHKDYEKRFNY